MSKYYIYRIIVGDKIYVGSTKDPKDRWRRHLNTSDAKNRDAHFKVYQEMRKHGVENCQFEVIREIDVLTKLEARMEEQKDIDLIPADLSLNGIRAHQSKSDRLAYSRQKSAESFRTKPELHKKHQLIRQDKRKNDPEYRERERLYMVEYNATRRKKKLAAEQLSNCR